MTALAQATERLLKPFTGTLLVLMVLVIAAQVLFRYVLNQSLAWTEEVGRYLFVWISLFGVSLGYRAGEHSGYESLVRALPVDLARAVMVGVDLLIAAFSLVLAFTSGQLISSGMGQLTPSTQIPIALIYLAFPLSVIPTLIFIADALPRRWRGGGG